MTCVARRSVGEGEVDLGVLKREEDGFRLGVETVGACVGVGVSS